jgi:hypothetical protein
MELAYIPVLETVFWEFNSPLPYHYGRLPERLNGTVLKTEGGNTHGGSNPSPSSIDSKVGCSER